MNISQPFIHRPGLVLGISFPPLLDIVLSDGHQFIHEVHRGHRSISRVLVRDRIDNVGRRSVERASLR